MVKFACGGVLLIGGQCLRCQGQHLSGQISRGDGATGALLTGGERWHVGCDDLLEAMSGRAKVRVLGY